MSSRLKLQFRGGWWYVSGTIAGQRIRKGLGTGDRRQAEELRAQYEATLWKRHIYGEAATRTFAEAARRYMSAGGEAAFLPPIIRRLGERTLASIMPEDLRQVAREIHPDAKASTRNRQVITPTRAVINHAAQLGWCATIQVKNFATEKVQRATVDRGWLDAFMAEADRTVPHLAAAMLFMHQNGVRVGEVCRVLPGDVDLDARTILLRKTKTDAFVAKHMTRELAARVAALLEGCDAEEPVFGYRHRTAVRQRMQAVCRRAKIPFVPTHQAGRHSFATAALAAGASLKEVMEGGGWKTAKMVLEIYAHAESASRAIADRLDAEETRRKAAPPKLVADKKT